MNTLRLITLAATASLVMGMHVHAAEPTSAQSLEPAVNTSALPPAASPAPAIAPAAKAVKPAAAAKPPATPGRKAQDRLELDATQITGNSELPRVLYVVPWKRSDLGDLTGRPVNSLLDEVLTPVDRDVFRRQNRYYEALRPDAPAGGSGRAAP
ncbi:MAG: hypothetical protein ABI616_04430 [Pseudomonadota bacterium]